MCSFYLAEKEAYYSCSWSENMSKQMHEIHHIQSNMTLDHWLIVHSATNYQFVIVSYNSFTDHDDNVVVWVLRSSGGFKG